MEKYFFFKKKAKYCGIVYYLLCTYKNLCMQFSKSVYYSNSKLRLFQWTHSFKEWGEYPMDWDDWDLAHIMRPNRPNHHFFWLLTRKGIAWLPNLLGELNPYTTISFRILPGTQQIGCWSACWKASPHCLHTKEVHRSPLNGTKLAPGLGQTLAPNW